MKRPLPFPPSSLSSILPLILTLISSPACSDISSCTLPFNGAPAGYSSHPSVPGRLGAPQSTKYCSQVNSIPFIGTMLDWSSALSIKIISPPPSIIFMSSTLNPVKDTSSGVEYAGSDPNANLISTS